MKKNNKSLLRYLSGILRVLFTPSCWIQIQRYSKQWDKKLNELMETRKFEIIDAFTARIGGFDVWIANHPYGSFNPTGELVPEVRPKRITILRAHDKLLADQLKFRDGTDARSDKTNNNK